jgi:hypothetical protein
LLDHEDEQQFLKLFESFRAYAHPEDIVDYHLVYNATVFKWETNRYRRMAMAVTSNQQQAGLKSLFMQTHREASLLVVEKMVEIEAARNARRCVTDPESREEAYMDLKSMGVYPGCSSLFVVASSPVHHRTTGGFGMKRDMPRL